MFVIIFIMVIVYIQHTGIFLELEEFLLYKGQKLFSVCNLRTQERIASKLYIALDRHFFHELNQQEIVSVPIC